MFAELHAAQPGDRQLAALTAECEFRIGTARFNAGDYPGAVQAFRRAAAVGAGPRRLYSAYGKALLFTGDPDGAGEAFRKQLAVTPNDYDANYYLAQILASRGRFHEAEPLLQRALAARPDSLAAQNALANAEVARFDRGTAPAVGVEVGQPAPALEIEGLHLPLPERGRPAVLVFGSYTCPNFRNAAPELNRLAAAYAGGARFLMIYVREAHSDGQWQSTINERERIALPAAASMAEKRDHASFCARKLSLAFPAVADTMDGAAEKAYAGWPSRVYVVGADGRVRYASGLGELEFDARALEEAVRKDRP